MVETLFDIECFDSVIETQSVDKSAQKCKTCEIPLHFEMFFKTGRFWSWYHLCSRPLALNYSQSVLRKQWCNSISIFVQNFKSQKSLIFSSKLLKIFKNFKNWTFWNYEILNHFYCFVSLCKIYVICAFLFLNLTKIRYQIFCQKLT